MLACVHEHRIESVRSRKRVEQRRDLHEIRPRGGNQVNALQVAGPV
jgi:hypothetical protein